MHWKKSNALFFFTPKPAPKPAPKSAPNSPPILPLYCHSTLRIFPKPAQNLSPKPYQKPETSYLRHDSGAVIGWARVRGDDGERGRNGSVGRMGKIGSRRVENDVLHRITHGVKIPGQTTVFRGIRTKYFRLIPAFFGIMRNYSEKMRGCAAF